MRLPDVLAYKAEFDRREELLEEMRLSMHEGGLEDLDKVSAYLAQFDDYAERA